MKYSFLKEEATPDFRTQLTFIGNELKIYLPKMYLDNANIASELGNKIETLSLFWFSVDNKYYEVSLPLKIQFEYHSRESFTGKIKDLPSIEYDVFILKNGDALCYNLMNVQKIDDLELFLITLIGHGIVPPIIGYDEMLSILLNLLLSSGAEGRLKAASVLFEIILSEAYRNKHNINDPFRKLITESNSASMYDFKTINFTKIPQLHSIFNALLGEDTYSELTSIIVRQKTGAEDISSPLEKLLKY